jgi:hypothetical protein
MPFKPWREKKRRKQGEKFKEGFIKKKIVLIIASHFPKGINEPELRDILRDNWSIAEPKGIKTHLDDLREELKLVKEEKKGFPNIWKLNQDYENFNLLAEYFLKSEDKFEFVKSKYVQSIIDENFVDHFAVNWGKEYLQFLWVKEIRGEKAPDKLEPDKLRGGFYASLLGTLTKDNFIKILKLSPTCLYDFLFPNQVFKNELFSLDIGSYFLHLFVSDMMHGLPEGKGIETELKVEYGGLRIEGSLKDFAKAKKRITPDLTAKSKFGLYNLTKKEAEE